MEWVEQLNESMRYIEENLAGEIQVEQAARIACCSEYHYQRMFGYLAGLPLSEYIRRRRMSLAAVDLLDGSKIIDTAIKYGYTSPTAFNRAFQSIHGFAPSRVKEKGVSVKSFPPISFHVTIKGGVEEMNYRIEKREAFRITGVSQPLFFEIEKNFEIVPGMWQKAVADGTMERLASAMDGSPMGLLGVSACGNAEEWRYFIAVASSKNLGEDFTEYTVPAATWAIFPGSGTNVSVQELERRIVTEWLPTSGYEYANAPDIEVYLNADPQNAKYEVWIPVVKK